MARTLDPKCKMCRHVGEKLYLKGERCYSPKCAMVRRPYQPGMHGPNAKRKRPSEFARELMEKQRLRFTYRLLERQFANYVEEASQATGNSGENLMIALEERLDNVVYRMRIVQSRDQARQIISHGHIVVNNRVTSYPSYQVRIGDEVRVKDSSIDSPLFAVLKAGDGKSTTVPSWVSFDPKNLKGQVTGRPNPAEVAQGLNLPLIAEYYSR